MKKIVVITTGGTIAMKYDAASGGLIPAVSGADLIEAVPKLKDVAEVTVEEFSNVPSGHMTPPMMYALAKRIDALSVKKSTDGFVVTHGTDTLEETAYLLSIACLTDKPIVVTGAMRGAGDMGYDGGANLLAAVRTAACGEAYARGALVVLNDEIHAAADVTKTHTVSCDTFASPEWGAVGHVYEDGVYFHRACEAQGILSRHADADVPLLKVYAGMDDFLFRCAADRPADGLVVEALGCGNVPPAVMRGIEYVREKGIPVVLASRVPRGRVVPLYGYPGSAGDMARLGLIHAGGLSGIKARLRLMLALSVTRKHEVLAGCFQT